MKRRLNEAEREAQQRHNIPITDAKRDYITRKGIDTDGLREGLGNIFGPSRVEKELAAREGISVEEMLSQQPKTCKHTSVDDSVRMMAMQAVDNSQRAVLRLQSKREPIKSVIDHASEL